MIDPFGEKLAGENYGGKSYSKFVTKKLSRSDRLSKIGNLCTTNLEQGLAEARSPERSDFW